MHPRQQQQQQMDPLQALRRMDFPYCVQEALKRLDQMVRQEPSRLKPTQPFVQMLVNEFIIFDTVGTSKHRRTLNSIQNLQLLEVLCDYFSLPGSDAARVMVFMALFQPGPGAEAAGGRRVSLLSRLVSLAVSTRSRPVLACAGAWLLQLGCTSTASLRLAEALLKDQLAAEAETPADELPQLAPLLTAGLLTAITHLYRDLRQRPPPAPLLRQVLRWLESSPSLPLVPLSGPGALPLPSSAPPLAAACPVAGLWSWTVLSAALHDAKGTAGEPTDPTMARLHLLLMTCLLEVPRLRSQSAGRPALLTQGQLGRLVSALEAAGLGRDASGAAGAAGVDPQEPGAAGQLALDRLAQLLQVALSVDGLGSSRRESLQQLARLRPTRLSQMVLQWAAQQQRTEDGRPGWAAPDRARLTAGDGDRRD